MRRKRTGLKKAIIDTGMGQNEFADHIAMNRSTLSGIVTGALNPNDEHVEKIAQGLDCEIQDVIDDFA